MLLKEFLPSSLTGDRAWQIALGVVFIAYLVNEYRSYSRLSKFPTPSWIAGFSSAWLFRIEMSGRNYLYLEEACEKYGQRTTRPPNRSF